MRSATSGKRQRRRLRQGSRKMLEKMGAMRTAYGEALVELGAANPRIVVVGADTTDSLKSGMFGAKYGDRFFNLGIAEQNLIGVAAGLAFGARSPTRAPTRFSSPGNAW